MPSILETADLWEGAYLLAAAGARLVSVRFAGNGHPTAFFRFEGGEGLLDHARTYRDGDAVANLVRIREGLNLLKDALFAGLREREKEGPPCLRPRDSRKRNG